MFSKKTGNKKLIKTGEEGAVFKKTKRFSMKLSGFQ
jgi:hypothetical protein